MIRRALFWTLLGLLLASHALVALQSLMILPLWEDEAFNLTVPLNLVAGLGYTSDGALSGSTLTPFDPRISTGAAVLLPASLIIMLGFDPVIGARIVPLVFWVLLLIGLGAIAARIGGRWATLVALTVPLAFATGAGVSPIQGPADLLGEIPAAALIVWALFALPKRPWVAGLLLGLAIQAKLIAFLALPAFAIALWVLTPGSGPRRLAKTLRRAWVPLILTGLPTLVMEIAAFLTLGPDGYYRHLRALGGFVRSGGQSTEPASVGQKLDTLFGAWFIPEPFAVLAALASAALIAGGIAVIIRRRINLPRRTLAWFAAALVGAASFVGWWAFATHTPLWVRHPAPGVLAFVPLLAAMAVWGSRTLWRGWPVERTQFIMRIGIVALSAVLAGALASSIIVRVATLTPVPVTLSEQREEVAPIQAWVTETQTPWLAAQPWGSPVSAVVLSGAHLGLFDAPAMANTPRLTILECEGETLVPGPAYRVCAAP